MEFQQDINLIADRLADCIYCSTRIAQVGTRDLPPSRSKGIKLKRLVTATYDFEGLVRRLLEISCIAVPAIGIGFYAASYFNTLPPVRLYTGCSHAADDVP
jgi:hypothetical protein